MMMIQVIAIPSLVAAMMDIRARPSGAARARASRWSDLDEQRLLTYKEDKS
jgi:hypothetical protein